MTVGVVGNHLLLEMSREPEEVQGGAGWLGCPKGFPEPDCLWEQYLLSFKVIFKFVKAFFKGTYYRGR